MTDNRGLHDKFVVYRTDFRDQPGEKHDCCDYFVLDLTHDEAAVVAVRAYVEACKDSRPALAADLIEQYGLDKE